MSGFIVKSWIGLLAPVRTPKPIIGMISVEIGQVMSAPDTREKLQAQEHEPFFNGPDQFAEYLRSEMARVGKIVKTANIRLEY